MIGIHGRMLKKFVGSEERVVIPEGVVYIDSFAFGRNENSENPCPNLKEIILPETVSSIDDFAFSKPTKYVQLDLNEQEKYEYDRAIDLGDNKYNMEDHNLCINNCHSHVAYVLNQFKYKGKSNYTMVHVWWLLIRKSKYVSFCSFIKTYLGFMIFLYIFWVIAFNKK